MEIVEPVRFFAGLALLLVGAVLLWQAREARGFSRQKQVAVVALAVGIVLGGRGLGLFGFQGLLG